MDVLSDVLRVVRLSGGVLFRAEFSGPWSVTCAGSREIAPLLMPRAKRLVLFHVIAEGHCWAEVENEPRIGLGAGDVIAPPL